MQFSLFLKLLTACEELFEELSLSVSCSTRDVAVRLELLLIVPWMVGKGKVRPCWR